MARASSPVLRMKLLVTRTSEMPRRRFSASAIWSTMTLSRTVSPLNGPSNHMPTLVRWM
jgi:hypothetical protein